MEGLNQGLNQVQHLSSSPLDSHPWFLEETYWLLMLIIMSLTGFWICLYVRKRAAKSFTYRLRALGSKGSTLRNDAANTFNEYLWSTVPTLFKASDTEMKSIVLVFISWLQECVYMRSEGWETGWKKKNREGMREKQVEVCIQVLKEVILFHKWEYRWECLKRKHHPGLDIISFRRSTEQWATPLKQ